MRRGDGHGDRALHNGWRVGLLAASIGLAAGIATTRLWRPSPEPTAAGPAPTVEPTRPQPVGPALGAPGGNELAELRARLEEESAIREELAREVAELREQIRLLSELTEPQEESLETSETHSAERTEPEEAFDEVALVAEGVPPDEARWLHERFDAFEMERLELLDQATREGWSRTPRYREEQRVRNFALREELGDDLYDRMLFATGRKNRIVIRDVLSHSPAEEVGLRPGDVVLRYDDRRIFNPYELQNATTGGRRGESVAVDILRNGQSRRIYVPRGPLGVRMRAERQPPVHLP
ncbi:MAG: PDZ domain-containing protein [Myxococcota bacterium]